MKAFEDASGEKLSEDKKELASEELITTGDLGEEIGQDKATGVINDVKIEVIKNNTHDVNQIAETINNVTNNYHVSLTDEQMQKITDLMEKISAQDYDYNSMKETLNNVSDVVKDNLEEAGETIGNSGILDTIGNFFSSIKDWFSNLFAENKDLGILQDTKDDILGSDAVINATDKAAEYLPTAEEAQGFFQKIVNWVKGLFNGDSKENNDTDNNQNQDNQENSSDDSLDVQIESEEHFD